MGLAQSDPREGEYPPEGTVSASIRGAKGEYFEAKDTSPSPKSLVKLAPFKDGTFKIVVTNNGPGANKVTLQVRVGE